MIHRIFPMVAMLVAPLTSGCESAQQPRSCAFNAGASGNPPVQQGGVARLQSTTIAGEPGVGEQLAGGAAGAAICARLTRGTSRETRAAASVACGANGSQAGCALPTRPRPVSAIVVRLKGGEAVSVLQGVTAAVPPGNAVFIVRRGACTPVVGAT